MLRLGRDLSWKDFFKKLIREWKDDALGDTAAALTYYGMLALFPFLLFLVSLTGVVLNAQAAANLIAELQQVAPPQVLQIVQQRLQSLQQSQSSGLVTIGFLASIWIASGAMSSLTQALDRCYGVVETRPFWKVRLLAIALTLVAGVLSVIAAAVTFAVPVAASWIGGPLAHAVAWLRFPVAGAIMMGFWSLLYRFLPNVKPKFQLISPGSIVGVVIWLAASWGFSEYVRHFSSYERSYGALGGVIVLLVWMWISSAVVLLGAEINKLLTPEEKIQREARTSERRNGAETTPPVPSPA